MNARFAVVLSFVAAVALAQEKVTHVNVVVTDAKGKAVHGLTAADFEVVDAAQNAVAVASAAEVTEPAPRRVLIFFDNGSLTLAHRRQVAAAMRSWVDAHVRPVDQVSIATSNPMLRTVLEWSSDRAAIAAALDNATRDAGNSVEQERRRAERLINDVIQRAAESDPRDPARPSFEEMIRIGRTYAASQFRDTESLISSLGAAMTWFASPTGRRVMIVAGEGLQRNPGYDMFEYLNSLKMQVETSGPEVLVPTARRASPLTEARQHDVSGSLRQLRDIARSRGIAIYAMNPGRGEDSTGNVESVRPSDTSAGFARTVGAMTGYDDLANATGGIAFAGTPPDRALAQVSSDLESYYELTYASKEIGDGVVRAKGANRVRATLTAAPLPPDERMREAVLSHHRNVPATNDLAIRLAMDPPRVEGADRVVPLKVLIPISNLKIEPAGSEVTGGFSVYISAANGSGVATRVVKKTHQFRWPPDALAYGQGKNMTFAIDVPLPEGYNAISVGVLDERSEKTGFDRVLLH